MIRVCLATLGDVLKTGRLLWGLRTDPSAVSDAIHHLQLLGLVAPSRHRIRRVSNDELDAIAGHWTGRTPVDALYILRDTAMRSGELCGLHWRNVDLRGRTIYLSHRKSRGEMTIPILGDLQRWHRLQFRPGGRVLTTRQATLSENFRQAARRARIPDIRLHDLRHEGISRLFEKGWTIPQVEAVSGHRSWANLQRYTHITAQQLLELPQ